MSKIAKSMQSYSIDHLPYYCSLYNLACALGAWRGVWIFWKNVRSKVKQGNIEILCTTLRDCTLMVASVQWISQSEYSIYIIILVEFYEKYIVYRWQKNKTNYTSDLYN